MCIADSTQSGDNVLAKSLAMLVVGTDPMPEMIDSKAILDIWVLGNHKFDKSDDWSS